MTKLVSKLLLVLLLGMMPLGYAEVPGTMSYQGYLLDSSGNPVEGTIEVTFSIPNTTWTEQHSGISVKQGVFNVLLGSQTSLVGIDFSQASQLHIDVNGTSQLNVPMSSVPFAFHAKTVALDSLNSLTCAKDQVAKWNGNAWACADDAEGSSGITSVTVSNGLTGGGTSGDVTLSVANNGINSAMLQNNSVNSSKIADGTVSGADIGSGQVVKSINEFKDNVTIAQGSGINVTNSENRITIAATGNQNQGDNLGNHTATQNIKLNHNWLSNDGDNEGLQVNNNGSVNVNNDLRVGDDLEVHDQLKVYDGNNSPYLELSLNSSQDAVLRLSSTTGDIRTNKDLVLQYQEGSRWEDLKAGIVHIYRNQLIFRNESSDNRLVTINASGNTAGYLLIEAHNDGYITLAGGETNVHSDLTVLGTARKPGGGSWSTYSDRRLKTNIKNLDSREALAKITQVQGVTYQRRNPEEQHAKTEVGIIAQDLEAVFPDWVTEAKPQDKDKALIPEGEKVKEISFPNAFNAYLIEAIKALKAENEALKYLVCQDHSEAEICL